MEGSENSAALHIETVVKMSNQPFRTFHLWSLPPFTDLRTCVCNQTIFFSLIGVRGWESLSVSAVALRCYCCMAFVALLLGLLVHS